MPAETSNPSVADILTGAPTAGGRVSIALAEIKRRLEALLPGVVAEMNDREGWDEDDTKIRVPANYYAGPVDDSENVTNAVLMAAASDSQVVGPQGFKGVYSIVIYSVDKRTNSETQYLRNWDRVELIRAVMKPFLVGCVNADGRQCWKVLQPASIEWIPEEFEQYSGIAVNYTMTCDPSMNGWAAL